MLKTLVHSPFFRFALVLPIVVGAILATVLYPFYQQLTVALEREERAAIRAEITNLEVRYQRGGRPDLLAALQTHLKADSESQSLYLFVEADGQVIAGNLTAWPGTLTGTDEWLSLRLQNNAMAIANALRLFDNRWLLVGKHSNQATLVRDLQRRLMIGFIASFLAVMVAASFLTHRLRKRLRTLGQQAELIRGGDLKERLKVSHRQDEIDALANTLNRMLEQIETLIHSSQHATGAIAHDMRTPLTRMRQRIEALLSHSILYPQVRDEIERIDMDLQHALDLFAAILRLARLQSGTFGPRKEFLRLDELIKDVCELYEPVADNRNAILHCQTIASTIRGDRDLLFQAFSNLIENALRFAKRNIRVEMSLIGRDRIHVTVSDDGQGFPAQLKERIFDPFVRGDTSRTTTGSGLGLALVRAILRAHDGDARIADVTGGARVELEMPLSNKTS